MKEKLLELWFNKKEIEVFLYLISFWISSASEIANKLNYPKSTVNFLADNLWKRWILKKSFRWKTGYYEADISNLEKIILDEISNKKNILESIIPELKEKTKYHISRPKIIFIDWLEHCQKAYLDILKTKTKYYEIWVHKDLVNSFGEVFMNNFIKSRINKNLICDAISNNWETEKRFKNINSKEKRELSLFDESIFWKIHSTIAIYENKVLILNLNWKNNWVLIENVEFYETMKTIFNIIKMKK
jgi:predicted transcriptional regulator